MRRDFTLCLSIYHVSKTILTFRTIRYIVLPGGFTHPVKVPLIVEDDRLKHWHDSPYLSEDSKAPQSIRNIQVRVLTNQDLTDRMPLSVAHYFIHGRCLSSAGYVHPLYSRSGDRATALTCNDKRCFGVLGQFTSSDVQYDTCRILLESDIGDIGAVGTQWVLKGISMLTGFKWVYMEFKKGITPQGYGWDVTTVVPYSKKKEMPFFKVVEQQLVPTLGPAVLVGGDVPVLVFRPRKYQVALAARSTDLS